jgi:hypothetical protein
MSGKVNKKLIQKTIFTNRTVQNKAYSIVQKKIEKEKILFKNEFESHPVTQELEAGENASNISGTLGGYGNLFSFLGFSRGASPVSPVKTLIQKIILNKGVRINKNKFIFKLYIPSKDEFGRVSRLPWESGRSWLLDIERGISGLGAYLFGKFLTSRSGTAIQSNYNYSKRRFRPVPYFGQMYSKFMKRLRVV